MTDTQSTQIFKYLAISVVLFMLLAGCSPIPAATVPPASVIDTPAPVQPTAASSAPHPTDHATAKPCASLIDAVKEQNPETVQQCLQQGADANKPDSYGLSPLNYAASFGNEQIVADLLAAGAEVNYQDPWGMTSLHAALKEGHDSIARMLIEHGADVNLQTTAGTYVKFTPLYTAIHFGKTGVDIIELLLQKGADANIPNQQGKTPLQLAREKGLKDVENLLIRYGAVEK